MAMTDWGLYQFKLPKELIAQVPVRPRDKARLLVYQLSSGTIIDDYFYNLSKFLYPHTTLVLNNSKVEHCRWLFDNGQTELFVLEKIDTHCVRAMVRPWKKFKVGLNVQLTDWLSAIILDSDEGGIRTLQLNKSHNDPRLKKYEHVPLPPYIAQDDKLAPQYQTVYARPSGSLAAPTAGLHFTPALLNSIKEDFPVAEITLHVGLGTFAKLGEENFKTGRLHEEMYSISASAAKILNQAKHITVVGTTTLRTLESAYKNGHFEAVSGATDIFIRPGYSFKAVDSLITNFHLPSTSLLMQVAAMIANKQKLSEPAAAVELKRIYQHAIDNRYRFYSFGDAMTLV